MPQEANGPLPRFGSMVERIIRSPGTAITDISTVDWSTNSPCNTFLGILLHGITMSPLTCCTGRWPALLLYQVTKQPGAYDALRQGVSRFRRVDREQGFFEVGADPRGDGAALGY